MKKILNVLKIKYQEMVLAVALFLTTATPTFAAEINANPVKDLILKNLVSPLFLVAVVYFVVKEFFGGGTFKAVLMLAGGAVAFFFIRDPEGFLTWLEFIPKKFGA